LEKTSHFFAKHLSIGGIISHLGCATGATLKCTASGIAIASKLIPDEDNRLQFENRCLAAGARIESMVKEGSVKVGDGVNRSIGVVSRSSGKLSGEVARMVGASEENISIADNVGTIVSSVVIGAVVGGVIANALVAMAAVAGTAGGAATTSGLAALGGGSIAAGGGGMAVGQVVVEAIVVAGSVSGASSRLFDDSMKEYEDSKTKLIS
jgi:hypothetical protein